MSLVEVKKILKIFKRLTAFLGDVYTMQRALCSNRLIYVADIRYMGRFAVPQKCAMAPHDAPYEYYYEIKIQC